MLRCTPSPAAVAPRLARAAVSSASATHTADGSGPIPWPKLHEKRFQALEGQPRFADFTADWCQTCKVNEATVLETTAVKSPLAGRGYVPLKGAWTRRDPYITDVVRPI